MADIDIILRRLSEIDARLLTIQEKLMITDNVKSKPIKKGRNKTHFKQSAAAAVAKRNRKILLHQE